MIAGFDWRWDILNENIPVDDFVCERNDHHFEHFIKDSAILYQKELTTSCKPRTINPHF